MLSKLKIFSRRNKSTYSIMVVGLDNCGKTSIIESIKNLINQQGTLIKSGSSSSRSLSDIADQSVHPTVGFNFEYIPYNDHIGFNVLDFSGSSRYRDLWQEFYCGVDAIVFVIDSSDPIRFVVARDELDTMLNHPFFISLKSRSDINGDTESKVKLQEQQIIRTNHNQIINTNNQIRLPHHDYQKSLLISNGKLVESPLDSKTSKKGSRPGLRTKIPILFLANKNDVTSSVDIGLVIKSLELNKLDSDKHPWHIQSTSVKTNDGMNDALNWLINSLSQG